MTSEMWLTLAILLVAIVLFITEWLRVDVVALGVIVALMLSGLLSPTQALSGFSSTTIGLMLALFIVGGAIFHTGLANTISDAIVRLAGKGETRLLVVVMLAVAGLSAFVSNTGTVALLLPAVITVATAVKVPRSRLLIPMAFASSLGGAMTLIGSPVNIVVSEQLQISGYEPFAFFDFLPIGVIMVVAGMLFMLLLGRKLLLDREPVGIQQLHSAEELIESYHLPDTIYSARVRKASPLIQQTLRNTAFAKSGVHILEISRQAPPRVLASIGTTEVAISSKRNIPIHPEPDMSFERDDIIYMRGEFDDVRRMAARYHLALQPKSEDHAEILLSEEIGVAEIIIPPDSALVGKTPVELGFKKRYQLTILNIKRPTVDESLPVQETPLNYGDVILVMGQWQHIISLKHQVRDFILVGEAEVKSHVKNLSKAPIALIIMIVMMGLMIADVFSSTVVPAFLAAFAIVVTGCMTMDEAYESIDWKSILLIAGMMPLALAIQEVGLADLIASTFISALGDFPPIVMLVAFFSLTVVFTQVLSNTATALLLAPIAIQTAIQMNVQPYSFMLGIAIAASLAFATPVATPVNTLVMTAGHYRFSDYSRVGIPMLILLTILACIVLPILFPF
ncbi:SLC13 family permease [Anaerolineales bacterium]